MSFFGIMGYPDLSWYLLSLYVELHTKCLHSKGEFKFSQLRDDLGFVEG